MLGDGYFYFSAVLCSKHWFMYETSYIILRAFGIMVLRIWTNIIYGAIPWKKNVYTQNKPEKYKQYLILWRFNFWNTSLNISFMYNESNGKDGSRKRLVLLGGDILSIGSSDGMCETHICSFLFFNNVWCMFISIGAQLRQRGISFEFTLEKT